MLRNQALSDLPSLVVVIVSFAAPICVQHKSFAIRPRTPLVPLALPGGCPARRNSLQRTMLS
jgi:hypothetical protein